MLRHSLAFGLLILASGVATSTARADFNGVLEERLHDFGTVPRGQQLRHYFRIANPSQKTLHISGVRVSCGCTSAHALSTTIPPGGETAVLAVMNSQRFVGSKQVTIYVTFDQPRFEELRTVVQAYSREDLVFSPDTINFGKIPQGAPKVASMNITFYNGSVQVTEAKSESNYIQTTFKEVRRGPSESVYQIEATVRADTPVGLWFSDIWVKTNNAGFTKLRVPVTVEVEGLQPAKTDSKPIEATKTSRNTDADTTAPTTAQTDEPPPYQTAPVFTDPAPAPRSSFSLFGFFRR